MNMVGYAGAVSRNYIDRLSDRIACLDGLTGHKTVGAQIEHLNINIWRYLNFDSRIIAAGVGVYTTLKRIPYECPIGG